MAPPAGNIGADMGFALGAGIAQAIAGIGDALVQDRTSEWSFNRQKRENREILQNQIQWRVKDAQEAGIHPLAALGVPPASGPSFAVGADPGLARAVENGFRRDQNLPVGVTEKEAAFYNRNNLALEYERNLAETRSAAARARKDTAEAAAYELYGPPGSRMNPLQGNKWWRIDKDGQTYMLNALDESLAESGEGFLGKTGVMFLNVDRLPELMK